MRHRAFTGSLAFLALTVLSHGQLPVRSRTAPQPEPFVTTIRVPEDVATLQEAIWLSTPEGTILVRGEQEPVIVDRPLTIVGNPEFVVNRGFFALGGPHCGVSGITLAGPGGGVATIVGLRSGILGDCAVIGPAIGGGGFDELRIYDSDLSSYQFVSQGSADGAPGIEVDADLVLVSHSSIYGGRGDVNECVGLLVADGYPAVLAPRSIVIVLDSTLEGGDGGYLCCNNCSCPQTLTGLHGIGGDGIVAQEVFQGGSSITGGTGSTFFVNGFPRFPCGSQPNGVSVVAASNVILTDALHGAARMMVGSSYTLSWSGGTGPFGGMTRSFWAAEGIQAPDVLPGGAWSFLPTSSTIFLGTLPATPASWTFVVPPKLGMLGRQYTFQAADENGTVTRPVCATLTL